MATASASGIVTLLSDFGTSDGYVAAMKGVVLGRFPGARIVDVTHEIPPHDVFQGAFVLRFAARAFPPGTVHVAVVDPGVGTLRRPLVVAAAGQLFVGPDNGVLSQAATHPRRAWVVERPELVAPVPSRTFQGRDVFAPVAAHLAAGAPPESVGAEVGEIVELPVPVPQFGEREILGEVVHADQFGNLVTNVRECDLLGLDPDLVVVTVGGTSIRGLRATFGEVPRGALLAYVGSAGFLEIARREGSARHVLGAPRGTPVLLTHGPART